jgi:YcaO-like protein with predicted kinase domain
MLELKPAPKVAHGRCVRPEETVARLEAILEPRHHYWLWEESIAEHLHWTAMFIDDTSFRAMGKGVTPLLSKAGALAEGAEWLTARETAQLPGYVAARQDTVEAALRIEDLVAHVATATPPVVERIKDLDAARHWVDGYSLRDHRRVSVPLHYVRQISGPNGQASGNCLEEAIVHATHEVFERRAHVTVLRNRMEVPTIDPESVDSPLVQDQLGFVRGEGIEVTLKDLSFGGALPCVGGYFHDPQVPADYQFHHFFKVGASFDLEQALVRVFTEYVQGRKRDEFIAGDAGQVERILEPDFRRLRTAGHHCDNFLSSFMFGFVPYRDATFLRAGEVVPFDRGPGYRDCLEDIDHARRLLESLGKDYVVVDLTDPDIGFPVVQVVVPGYSDVLPFHPATSAVLFETVGRDDVLRGYP